MGDGNGRLSGGSTARLDYLQELGVTAIWLLPFYPSPLARRRLRTISDYTSIHPGLRLAQGLQAVSCARAHRRGLKVITEAGDQTIPRTSTPWFQARPGRPPGPGAGYRNFYVWSDDPQEKYADARASIFKELRGGRTGPGTRSPQGPTTGTRFFLPPAGSELSRTRGCTRRCSTPLDFWMEAGVGRPCGSTAVPYPLRARGGPIARTLPETHAFPQEAARPTSNERFAGRPMLLAEGQPVAGGPRSAYFGEGDEVPHGLPLSRSCPGSSWRFRMEGPLFQFVDILQQTPAPSPRAASGRSSFATTTS